MIAPGDLPVEQRIAAVGIVPVKPVFFYDVDLDECPGVTEAGLTDWLRNRFSSWDLYETKGGWHLVGGTASWDHVQKILNETVFFFPDSSYPRNCRKLRLRISPKWHGVKGEVSHEPILWTCGCPGGKHVEKRIGKKEGYWTGSE